MAIKGGAHVQIGAYEYMLDRSKPEPYNHRFESLFSQTTAIAGEIAKQQLRPEKMLWYMTDWSGGEGFKIYYPQEPTRYDVASLMNVTQRGILTTRARRYRFSVARNSTVTTTVRRPAGGSAWNKALIFWGDNLIYSKSATGWTAKIGGANLGLAHDFFDCDTDGRYLVTGVVADSSTAASFLPSSDGSLAAPTVSDINSSTNMDVSTVAEILEGVVYCWALNVSTLQLRKGVGAGTANAFSTLVYNSGIVPAGNWGTDYWTDIESAENALYMSFGTPSSSVVLESRQDIGRPFWTGPPGFTIKKLMYHAGVLFCIGSQAAAGKKFAAMWAIPLSTRAPIFIAAPRRHKNTELFEWTIGCPGYGSNIFIADANSGKIFIYDIENDALSLFDDLANGGTGDGTTFIPYGNLLYKDQSGATDTLALSGWAQVVTTFTVVGAPLRNGTQAFNFAASTAAVGTTPTGLNGIPVTASTQYTFSGWGHNASGSGTLTCSIVWYDSAGAVISTSTGSPLTTTTTWQVMFVTDTSPSNAVYAAMQMTAQNVAGEKQADDLSFHLGSATTVQDQLAFLAMHGSRLFGATWQPLGVDTSLQIVSWDDTLKENRDASQAISATQDSAEWDFGVPQEQKALNGVYVNYEITDNATTSGLVANSRITISYALDAGIFTDTFTALTTMTSATAVLAKGRHFIPVSDGTTTVKFNRIKFRITLDNNGQAVAPPIVYSVVPEAQLLASSEVWDLVVRIQDEANNERPKSRQWKAHQLMDNLEDLAQNKNYVTFIDGIRYAEDENHSTTHVVQVEDPQFVIEDLDTGEGYCQVRLRSVPV